MGYYWPEGMLLETEENRYYLQNEETLQSAMRIGQILEGRALLCDYDHNLVVDMGCCRGIIPREEGALGIKEQTVRDIAIISRVNKSVCFLITAIEHDEAGAPRPILSRRAAQLRCRSEYIDHLTPGEIIPARVTHLESFGCFVDIGCGLPSLISIDQISVSRISHPRDRFAVGESIYAVVKAVEPEGRVQLSHKELLGPKRRAVPAGRNGGGCHPQRGGLWRLCGADPQPGRPGGALRGRARRPARGRVY